jgi:1,4-dihydroxy-2-naphthoate octaprenyltransferase
MVSAKPKKPPASRLIVGLICIPLAILLTVGGFMIGSFGAGLFERF